MDRRSAIKAAILGSISAIPASVAFRASAQDLSVGTPFAIGGLSDAGPLVLVPSARGNVNVLSATKKDGSKFDGSISDVDFLNDPTITLSPSPDQTIKLGDVSVEIKNGQLVNPKDLNLAAIGGGWKETSFWEIKK